MANDLVRWRNGSAPAAAPAPRSEWNLPPELDPSTPPPGLHPDNAAAREAAADAARGRRRGDTPYAVTREEDAADLTQSPWDWGDRRTWLWIAAMCLGFLLFTAFVYFLPQGQHNQSDGGNTGGSPTPAIRVY